MKYAKIVWDGNYFQVPEELGKPRADQLTSTHLDNLCELSGRTCYDSLGSGRNSKDYHSHIIEVGHGSIWEHANITFSINLNEGEYFKCIEAIINRPGIWVSKEKVGDSINLRITANLRSIREWFRFPSLNETGVSLGNRIQYLAKQKAPLVLQDLTPQENSLPLEIVAPKSEAETWVSIFFTNVSRGFSHELVRHKYKTGVSQRSTRYVDESNSPWCWHPLLNNDEEFMKLCESQCKDTYNKIVEKYQKILTDKGIDKLAARKQCRGAARGFLGNALMTELVFSASLDQWKWMIHMRASKYADAEIRLAFNEVYDVLSQKFPDSFQGYEKALCEDGLGYEVIKT